MPKSKPTPKAVEEVAESLGTVAIFSQFHLGEGSFPKLVTKGRKWTRQKVASATMKPKQGAKTKELGKRTLVDVVVSEGALADFRDAEKKFKGDVEIVDIGDKNKEVVLEGQHHRSQ